jgi:uncharacterized heparinase superfamily protein
MSFEFSAGAQRIVVNCGMPSIQRDSWRQVARATAAHSTVTLNDTSSCRFLTHAGYSRLFGIPIVAGPGPVRVTRVERESASLVRAVHDGYVGRFGIMHQRSWRLSNDGSRLDGEDVFFPAEGEEIPPSAPDTFAIRFHLHPSIKASRLADGRTVLLVLPGSARETWLFSAPTMRVDLEESVFLSSTDGPRRTSQIVITGEAREVPRVVWTFIRTEMPQVERREAGPGPELPL